MKKFLDKDFILNNETAKVLYHEYAAKMPIYDYHCHLSAKDIYEDKKYESITDLENPYGTLHRSIQPVPPSGHRGWY